MSSNSVAVIDWRRRAKRRAIVYKGGRCVVCAYSRSPRALSFHHLDPTQKDFNFSGLTRAWSTIKAELDKCVLLCGNCHQEHHDGLLDLAPYLTKNPSPQEGDLLLSAAGIAPRSTWGVPTCQRCGASVSRGSTYCKPCHKKAVPPPTKITWPLPEDLIREVEATSKRAVATRLGVSDVAVKKRLVRYLPGYKPRPYQVRPRTERRTCTSGTDNLT